LLSINAFGSTCKAKLSQEAEVKLMQPIKSTKAVFICISSACIVGNDKVDYSRGLFKSPLIALRWRSSKGS